MEWAWLLALKSSARSAEPAWGWPWNRGTISLTLAVVVDIMETRSLPTLIESPSDFTLLVMAIVCRQKPYLFVKLCGIIGEALIALDHSHSDCRLRGKPVA